jgi:uncharacterized Zn finger protein
MNPNILLAVLEQKAIITEEEAEKLAEHLANATQSAYYKDAQNVVKKLLADAVK